MFSLFRKECLLAGLVIATMSASARVRPGDAPHWIKMPLLTAEARKAGVTLGGEGSQWPRGPVAVSPADPDFLLLPIDVGGLYRSLDGGKTWDITMVGWDARGANAFAIDPRNARHVLGIAGNSMNWERGWGPSPHGIYLSSDKAASWTHVLAANGGFTSGIAFDPTSYDPTRRLCLRAYYLESGRGLYRSDDGGEHWVSAASLKVSAPSRDWTQGGSLPAMLQVDAHGTIYAGGVEGLFRSADKGHSFTLLRKAEVDGLCLTPDGTTYLSGMDGVSVSHDGAQTFTRLPCQGLDRASGFAVNGIAVSPVDPRRMLCWVGGPNFTWPRYTSADGGATWQKIKIDNTLAVLPGNARQGYAAWSPKNADVAWSIGGDWVTQSADGGRSFHWANSGYNGVMAGGTIAFNPRLPDLVAIGFQDYNGAFTTDGGKTWNYRDVSGLGWGGHEHGMFAANRQVTWYTPRRLRISRDGGMTWAFVPGADGKPLEQHGLDVSLADPKDANVYFASDLRTADTGNTWSRMTACDSVIAAAPLTGTLWGKKGNSVVTSADHGVTWHSITEVEGGFQDLAIDPETARLYVASQDRLKVYQRGHWTTLETPHDQFGNQRVWSVAVDPQDPRVLYIGGPRNVYTSQATIYSN
jgi:hypothetical protein